GRPSYVEFRERKSWHRRVKQGIPQDGIEIVSYADDCTIMALGRPPIFDIWDRLNVYLNGREVNPELTVMVDGEMIPTIKCSKVLGVTFDSSYTFCPFATTICDKIKSRNKVLKSLAGNTWGADKE
uniref:Reverse transcriptase domain-containing protein n=1 Tax=Stomoxys calcitrans TaxID=35570 RepID=A0A1I8NZT9_STOCA